MCSIISGMMITHRIALDPANKQKTLLRQHAGYARFVWNWGLAECRRALDPGEPSATRQQRIRPLFNVVKTELAPWSKGLSQKAARCSLMALGENSRACARSHKCKRVMETLEDSIA